MPRPEDSLKTPRFSGIVTFARLPHTKNLEGINVCICGIPFDDATTYRPGARFGPRAVREASVLLRPYNPHQKVEVFEVLNIVDYGDIPTVPGYIKESFEKIEMGIREILKKNVFPISIGGDHSITLPILRAFKKKYGKVSLLQFDSHSDTWDEYFGMKYNHGTTMRRALEEEIIDAKSSLQIGIRGSIYSDKDFDFADSFGLKIFNIDEFFEMGVKGILREISRKLKENVYVSLDIDVVDPAFAPGTGTPEVGGMSSREILEIVRGFKFKAIGFDVVEVSPPYDSGNITCLLAANIIYDFLGRLALLKD